MLKGNSIYLRALEDKDLETLRYWRNHPDLMPYHCSCLLIPEIGQRRWYETHGADPKNLVFIVENNEQSPIGYTLIKDLDHKNRNAEIGLHLDPAFHGKGYGKDAFNTLIRYCFHELNLHRVHLEVFDFNEPAIRMYQKMGFKQDGRLREAFFTQNRFCDIVVMSLLKNEFEE